MSLKILWPPGHQHDCAQREQTRDTPSCPSRGGFEATRDMFDIWLILIIMLALNLLRRGRRPEGDETARLPACGGTRAALLARPLTIAAGSPDAS